MLLWLQFICSALLVFSLGMNCFHTWAVYVWRYHYHGIHLCFPIIHSHLDMIINFDSDDGTVSIVSWKCTDNDIILTIVFRFSYLSFSENFMQRNLIGWEILKRLNLIKWPWLTDRNHFKRKLSREPWDLNSLFVPTTILFLLSWFGSEWEQSAWNGTQNNGQIAKSFTGDFINWILASSLFQ